jgi:hypothetical protein
MAFGAVIDRASALSGSGNRTLLQPRASAPSRRRGWPEHQVMSAGGWAHGEHPGRGGDFPLGHD